MTCWVCKRQARGFCHADIRYGVGHPQRYSQDWVFCSRRCQDVFHTIYGNWRNVAEGSINHSEVVMINPSDIEIAAMQKCLKPFGDVAGTIGFTKPLGQYTEAEALLVIDAIITGYTDAMAHHHAETKYYPVRGIAAAGDDPMRDRHPTDAFAELEDKQLWENRP